VVQQGELAQTLKALEATTHAVGANKDAADALIDTAGAEMTRAVVRFCKRSKAEVRDGYLQVTLWLNWIPVLHCAALLLRSFAPSFLPASFLPA
jgi:hypothetical protein